MVDFFTTLRSKLRMLKEGKVATISPEEAAWLIYPVSEELEEEHGYPPYEEEIDEGAVESPEVVAPDSKEYPEVWKRGARHGSAKLRHKGVVFHHTAGTLLGTIDWLTKHQTPASYHVIIDEDGTRYRLVDDTLQAWHAGSRSSKLNGTNPNHTCLGIAFIGDTVTGKWRKTKELNEDEIASAIDFLETRWDKFGLSHEWVTDHRTCDPTRRNDLDPSQLAILQERLKQRFK